MHIFVGHFCRLFGLGDHSILRSSKTLFGGCQIFLNALACCRHFFTCLAGRCAQQLLGIRHHYAQILHEFFLADFAFYAYLFVVHYSLLVDGKELQ